MPWLLLEMGLSREIEEIPLSDGRFDIKPGAPATMKMTAIDTDKGKVTEVEYQITRGQLRERAPSVVEVRTASKVLGKDKEPPPDPKRSKLEAQLRNSKALLMTANRENQRLQREVERLRRPQKKDPPPPQKRGADFDQSETDVIEAALFDYIGILRENVQLKTYSKAKELYRRVTGRDYEPFTESEIDEEGD